jgi:hypothetical protein
MTQLVVQDIILNLFFSLNKGNIVRGRLFVRIQGKQMTRQYSGTSKRLSKTNKIKQYHV